MSEAHAKIVEERPSLVLFAYSSGYPLYRVLKAISSEERSMLPPVCLLPLSNHHFSDSSKKDILANFREVKQNTYAYASRTIRSKLQESANPASPIILLDEVLSGSCVVGIRNALKDRLESMNVKNEIKIIGISSQKHITFKKSVLECASFLIDVGLAFINPSAAKQIGDISYEDLQLTPAGLKTLLSSSMATFKNLGFRRLVNKDIAYAIPVIDLFTTDNLDYNPLLFLNKNEMRLETRAQSYSFTLLGKTSTLIHQISTLERE
jgi:hypothetical protein